MRLRSPAEFYIKGLISHPRNYSDTSIIEMLEERGLDAIQEKYIKRLRERLVRPSPFHPAKKQGASYRFIMREGIFHFFVPDDAMKLAFRLLERPRAKEFVETMFLSHAPHAAIAAAIARQYRDLPCTPLVLERYHHYFWNIELLDSVQMRSLLNYRQEVTGDGEGTTKEDKAEYRAAKKGAWLDPRRLAADLPFSPVTALMAQMRMGIMPNGTELAQIMEVTRRVSSIRALEASMYGGESDSHRALNFTLVAKNMGEMLETVVKPDEALRKDLERIALKTDMLPVPTLHQLSDGHHTVDLQPKDENDDGSASVDGGSEETMEGELAEAEDDPPSFP